MKLFPSRAAEQHLLGIYVSQGRARGAAPLLAVVEREKARNCSALGGDLSPFGLG